MGVQAVVAALIDEAEQQAQDGAWELTPTDRALALSVVAGLAGAVDAAPAQEMLPAIERLAQLREAVAVLAMALARTHGRLAWFLAACIEALSPVLHWRALPAGGLRAFDTVRPTPEQYTDAEHAVRALAAALTRLAA
ncbi:hypothetical protein [Streptomyces sp. WAC06614]|uniref:hypothetical protein n=1 Tax=Streptomyces sp. WAC06614 TaxID=2487416 RepID=UPI000F78D4E8|nr:hypothetical protein [Streptomyces sp. WAC06614]RSS81478.1 hypothetical protein EF918_10075 [Streptomyces sp. WAC06614]